ncbi:hypothetical protein JY651_27740 [Pyxidicoccus parkwayensis]|uniref:Uncharacterized protein n=1 Tax=Pyxidicoccus parkwayensis TaxID=2813578 RepID=A0ABX7PCI9_9BACT|nr:hypothetical protein JY651_27740 [Pyxidicoccus parkwaysis]
MQEFRENHAEAFAAEEAAAKLLSDALNDPELLAGATYIPDIAKKSLDAAKLLGESSQAQAALEWAAKVMDPNGPAGTSFEGLKDQIDDDVVAPALTTASGQLLAENHGDAQAALQQLAKIANPLIALSKNGNTIKTGLESIQAALASGDPNALAQLSKSGSKLGVALAGVGAAYGLVSAVGEAKQGEWANFIKDMANSGRSGAQVASTVLRTLGETGRIAAQSAEMAADVLARLAPALGILANALVLADHFKDFLDDPTVGSGLQAFGDLVATAGAAVGTVLPGVGQVVEGVGLVLATFGGLLINKEKQDEMNKESEGILLEMGVEAGVAETLAHGDDQPERLSSDLGLSPAQIQDLARRYPTMFDAPGLGQAVIDAAKACGMKGPDAMGFIDTLSKGRPDFAWDLLGVVPNMRGDGTHPTATDASWRTYVQGRYPDAYAYAQQHAPDLFGKNAESRLQAGQDFEHYAGTLESLLVYANLCEQHKGDTAYTSEFIHRMKDNGSLDNFVQVINQSGQEAQRSGAKAALDAAVKTGVLSEADIQNYMNGSNGGAWHSILGR